MANKEVGVLVFRTSQNKPMKVFIGNDAATYNLSDGVLSCMIERQGIVTKVACEAVTELVIKLSDKVVLKIERYRNQAVLYIKADKTVHIVTEKNRNKDLTVPS